jgi:hypothetical protein
MNQKEIVVGLLRCLSQTLERASASDIDKLLCGEAKLVITKAGPVVRDSEKRDVGFRRREDRSSKNLNGMMLQLRQLESRDEGSDLLSRARLTKKELEELAHLMDLPVSREDDAERLRQKIVQESIGARLNSQAIRGS